MSDGMNGSGVRSAVVLGFGHARQHTFIG